MKIAYLSSSIIPSRAANSVHVMKMGQSFAKNGHNVVLYAPDRPNTEDGVNDYYKFYGVDKCFEVKKMPWLPIKGRGYIYGLLTALDVKKSNPDLAYGRNLASCFFSALLGLPVVYESHKPVSKKTQKLLFNRIIKNKNFKQLVVISDALKNYYLENYDLRKDMITVAHDGADVPRQLDEDELYDFNSDRLQVGYIGQLYPGKGMEVISELVKNCSWADFHIVGGNQSDIDYWRNELDEFDNVIFYGYIPNSETNKYRQSFDVVLAPYQKKVEGFGGGSGSDLSKWMSPLKIFEYMAARKVIISSDLQVLKEVLADNKNALLCNPDDIGEWIKALKRLNDDLDLREKLSKKAKQDFENNYIWSMRVSNVLDAIDI